MGKLSLLRLVLFAPIFAALFLSPTESFSANWLEKMFSQPKGHTSQRHRPRAAKKLATPVDAPIPEMRPDNEPPVDDDEIAPDASGVASAPAPSPQAVSPDVKAETPLSQHTRASGAPPIPDVEPGQPAEEADKGTIDIRKTSPETLEIIPEPNGEAALAVEPDKGMPAKKTDAAKKSAAVEAQPAAEAAETPVQGKTAIVGTTRQEEPDVIPIPEPNPRLAAVVKPDDISPGKGDGAAEKAPKSMLPDPRTADRADPSGKMPAEEMACRARLRELGVEFDERKAEANEEIGCTIPYPIMVKSLGKDIGLSPDAEMNCAMAESAAKFLKDVVSPAAQAEMGSPLKSISQASAYVCRPRHGTRKLSEHAFGNALDVATFNLADKTAINVEATPPSEQAARFLAAVRKAACGPFKTVLGPGSDADHALHFHLDLEPRRNGGTFCQ